MKYLKFLCFIGIFITNRYVLFCFEFFFICLLGYLSLPSYIFEIYFNVHIILFPFIFYVFENTIFREFEDHRRFFKEILNQLKEKK
jgi:hypothetical protein